MIEFLLIIITLLLIGLAFFLNNFIKNNTLEEKELFTIKLISFLFPFVGLIIYAVNIGSNSNLAKVSLKWALIGMFLPFIVLFVFLIISFTSYNKTTTTIESKITIPVASTNITPNSLITEEMIEYVSIFENQVDIKHISNKEDIINHYTSELCTIPQGGVFTTNCITEKQSIVIPDGHVFYTLKTDDNYGNSIFPGDRVDLYVLINSSTIGILVESIEIVEVDNHEYYSFIVTEEIYLLLNKIDSSDLGIVTIGAILEADTTIYTIEETKEFINNTY